MISAHGAVLGVTFWIDKDFNGGNGRPGSGGHVGEKSKKKQHYGSKSSYHWRSATPRYFFINIKHSHEVVVEGFAETGIMQMKALVETISSMIRFELFNCEGKTEAIFRVESYRNALKTLKLPSVLMCNHGTFEFKVLWAWVINANTKFMQLKLFGSPTKDSGSSNENTARITALQNQIKMTQKMGIKENKMNLENNKN